MDLGANILSVGWLEELDCIPLGCRQKMLHSIKHSEKDGYLNAQTIRGCGVGNVNEDKLSAYCSSSSLFVEDSESSIHKPSDCSSSDSVDCFVESDLERSFENSSIWSHRIRACVGGNENQQFYGSVNGANISNISKNVVQNQLLGSRSANLQTIGVKYAMLQHNDDGDDVLDNVSLKERRKLLLSRNLMQSPRSNLVEQDIERLSNISKVMTQRVGSDSFQHTQIANNRNPEVNGCDNMASENAIDGAFHASIKCSPPLSLSTAVSLMPKTFPLHVECESFGTHAMSEASALSCSVLPLLAKVKDEPLDTLKHRNLEVNERDDMTSENVTDGTSHAAIMCSSPISVSAAVSSIPQSSPLSAECKSFGTLAVGDVSTFASSVLGPLAKVKDEPCDINELCFEIMNIKQTSFADHMPIQVKNEPVFPELIVDELDHMPLIDRGKLYLSEVPCSAEFKNPECFKEDVASALDLHTDVLESVGPVSINRHRKKRRTATNLIETALEEDVPGLLKVLLDRGVSSEEIKLYGEHDSNDDLDSPTDDGFVELEAVISQLFSRETFMKFPLIRTKSVKISYSLSCLFALVEQAIYLRNRKWPVEWGWCRDLQSFIFVFQRHNRIVLERPEYGYATYFFELLNYVPVAWQIKRLVIAMKLTGCGRITIIENKPLVVGQDLSEGEARVLSEYGWIPNTGLGTMLHYCDRVVHDRKQDLDSCEWRMKIGKLLMNGYNGGKIVCRNSMKNQTEYQDSKNVQVKLEEWTV